VIVIVSTPSPAALGETETTQEYDEVPVQDPEAPSGEALHVTLVGVLVAVPVIVIDPVHVTVRVNGSDAFVATGADPAGGGPPGRKNDASPPRIAF
jgi:hypothetical protein